MIASLPMYDRAETCSANDRFWCLIKQNLGFGPDTLTRSADPWVDWQSGNLLFSQTCSLPFRTKLYERVALVGTPDYGLEGCGPGEYRSVILVRKTAPHCDLSKLGSLVLAINDPLSQSGWAAAVDWAKSKGSAFRKVLQTGSHRNSALAVVEKQADMAAIDAQTWRMIRRYDAFGKQLHILDTTTPTPALPFITSRASEVEALFSACAAAIGQLSAADKRVLGLRGLVRVPAEGYLSLPIPPAPPE